MFQHTQFEVIGEIAHTELIAEGRGIRERGRLIKFYGGRNWRKKKGIAINKGGKRSARES